MTCYIDYSDNLVAYTFTIDGATVEKGNYAQIFSIMAKLQKENPELVFKIRR